MTSNQMEGHVAVHQPEWEYRKPPPTGKKLHLLTVGKTEVIGQMVGALGKHYIAWAPLLKRDRETERDMGYL